MDKNRSVLLTLLYTINLSISCYKIVLLDGTEFGLSSIGGRILFSHFIGFVLMAIALSLLSKMEKLSGVIAVISIAACCPLYLHNMLPRFSEWLFQYIPIYPSDRYIYFHTWPTMGILSYIVTIYLIVQQWWQKSPQCKTV